MTIWKKIWQAVIPKRLRKGEPVREQVLLATSEPDPERTDHGFSDTETAVKQDLKLDREIDFSRVTDLEAYTENLDVPEETIEQWISAGLLSPEELRTAERMIKIIRKKGDSS